MMKTFNHTLIIKKSTPIFILPLLLLTALFYNNVVYAQPRIVPFTTPGTSNWIAPCGVTSITVECWGAGGGGGRKTGSTGVTGGGGGGAYASSTRTVVPGTSYLIVVGGGGVGNSAAAGGDSYFINNATVMAKGGAGVSNNATAGVNGGQASLSVGLIKYNGGIGGTGSGTNAGGGGAGAGSTGAGGPGAAPAGGTAVLAGSGGNGGAGRSGTQGLGNNGNSYGGGGGGAFRNGNSFDGGTGANGAIKITYTGNQPYCEPTFTTLVEPITNVTFAGINNTSLLTATRANPYREQNCISGNVVQGYSYPISLKGNTNGNFTDYFSVYIDWNQDFDFADVGESFNIGTITNSTGTDAIVLNGSIAIPATALTGTTTMRVMKIRAGTYPGPCDAGAFRGEAEDYLISVTAPVPCAAPLAQPTALVLTPALASIGASFTASASASGYLVIRTTTSTAPSNPVNGTVYIAGSAALGGYVDYVGPATSFTSSGLTPSTTYWYWVYAYNDSYCTGTYLVATSALNGSATTIACVSLSTLYWAGLNSPLTGATTGTDFNTAANWSTNSTTRVPPAQAPTACNNVMMTITTTTGNTAITFSQPYTLLASLTTVLNGSGATGIKSFSLLISNRQVIVVGNTSITTNNNGTAPNDNSQTEINVSTNGIFTYGGDLTTIINRTGTGYAFNYPFSNTVGEQNLGTVILKGNASFLGVGNDVVPQLNKPNKFVFDGIGTQTITNNNVFVAGNYDAIHLGHQTIIGELNTPTVILTGTNAEGFTTVQDLNIKAGATLDIRSTQKLNRLSAGGTFTMGAAAVLKLEGITGGETGSNFPALFSTHALSPTSTVEYNGAAQTLFGTATYGNLILSGTGIKTAPSTTLTVQGNLSKSGIASFAHNNGLVLLNGATTQSFAGLDYYGLELTAGTKNTDGNSSILDLLKINSTAVLNINNAQTISLLSTSTKTARVDPLLHADPTTAITYTGTGKFFVERNIVAGRKWRYLSIPTDDINQTFKSAWQENAATALANPKPGYGFIVGDQTTVSVANGFDLQTLNGPSIKTYQVTGNTYTGIPISTGMNTTIKAVEALRGNHLGYMAFVPGDRSVVTFNQSGSTTLRSSGKLYVGPQTVNIPIGPAENFRGIGNPYASPINMIDVINPATFPGNNLSPAYYIYDPRAAQLGAFITLFWDDFDFRVSAPGSAAYPYLSIQNNLESGAAFFVKSTNTGVAVVNFSESVKKPSATQLNFTAGAPQMLSANLSRISATAVTMLMDGLMARFDSSYSNDLDASDILKMGNTNETVGLFTGGKKLAVEQRTLINNNDTLHIHMSSLTVSNYKWDITADNLDYPGRTGYLIDRYLNTSTPLNMAGTTTVNFSIVNIPGSYAADRFNIVFQQSNLGPVPVTITSIAANRNNDQTVAVQWKVENELNLEGYLVERSVDGRNFTPLVGKAPLYNNGSSASYNITDTDIKNIDLFYRIKASSTSGRVQYSAIVKLAAQKQAGSISIYPNPVVEGNLQLHFVSLPKGTYQLQLVNAAGQLVYKTAVTLAETSQTETLSVPNTKGNYHLNILTPGGQQSSLPVLIQ